MGKAQMVYYYVKRLLAVIGLALLAVMLNMTLKTVIRQSTLVTDQAVGKHLHALVRNRTHNYTATVTAEREALALHGTTATLVQQKTALLAVLDTNNIRVKDATNLPTKHEETQSQTCTPVHKVYFLKIHKTGSSTADNIFKRYALHHNLSYPVFYPFDAMNKDMNKFLIPVNKFLNYTMEKQSVRKKSRPAFTFTREEALRENLCDIIDTHTIFNQTAVHKLLGKNSTNVVTLRHPFAQMQSVLQDFNIWPHLKLKRYSDESVRKLLLNPKAYDKNITMSIWSGLTLSFTKDFMSRMLGYKPLHKDGLESVDEFLIRMSKSFPVVILLERHAESLVLLRRTLCWDIKDVVSIYIYRSRDEGYRQIFTPVSPENQWLINLHRDWSTLDYAVYDMFIARHDDQVKQLSDEFQQEVQVLKEINSNITDFCHKIYPRVRMPTYKEKNFKVHVTIEELHMIFSSYLHIKASIFNEAFNISASDCIYLGLQTHQFKWFLALRQFPQLCHLKLPPKEFNFPEIYRYCPKDRFSPMVGPLSTIQMEYGLNLADALQYQDLVS